MRLLDADILIDLLRGHAAARAWFVGLPDVPSVPGFALMEVIQGCRNTAEVHAVQSLVAPLSVIWPTEANCQRALADFTAYHLPHGLGLLDSLIAACAIGQGAILCTFNTKHYRVVPGLVTEQPYAR